MIAISRLLRTKYALLDVPPTDIAPGSITTADLADGAVTTPKLADGAVTIAKLNALIAPDIYSPNRAALSATNVAGLPDLTTARVFTAGTSALSFWRLEKTSALTADGINVLAATIGRWIRVQVALYEAVIQTTWFVDYAAGNNEADGLTLGTAIQDDLEWFARTQAQADPPGPGITTTMNLIGTVWPHRWNYAIQQRGPGSFTRFFIVGQQTVSRAGTTTAASTNPNLTTEYATITDAAVVSWAADVGKLIVAANGSAAWILKDLGGGVARVTSWATPGGGTSPAPPITTAYNVVTLTQIGVNTAPSSPLNTFYVQDVQMVTGIRSTSPLMGFLRCKFTSSQVGGMWMGLLTTCLIQTGTWRLSNDSLNAAISQPAPLWAQCGVLNTVVSYSHGYLELINVAFQGSRLALKDVEVQNLHTGGIGNAALTITGSFGVAFFDAPAGSPALFADYRATVNANEALFGVGNLGTGVQLGHESAFFIKSTLPVLASAGAQLVVPADPIPRLVPGLVVPLSAPLATFAALAAAPFNGQAFTCDEWCMLKVG